MAEAWSNLGLMHQFLGDYREASSDFQSALQKDPHLYVPNLFLGLDLLRFEEPREALRYLNRAERLNPQDEQAAAGLGRAYEAVWEYKKSNDWYYRAVELRPEDTEAWYDLASSYLMLQRQAVERLQRLGAHSPYVELLGAEALLSQDKPDAAITMLRKIAEGAHAPFCIRARLGFAYIQEHDLTAAQRAFDQELRVNPGCLLARAGLAKVFIENAGFEHAYSELNVVWKSDRGFLRAHAGRLWQGLSGGELDAWETRVKSRMTAGDSRGLMQLLIDSLESQTKSPDRPFLAAPDAGNRRDQSPRPAQRHSPTSAGDLYAQGHFTRCAEVLGPMAGSGLGPADLLLLAQCAYWSGNYRTALVASESLSDAAPKSVPALYWEAKSDGKLAADALARMELAATGSPESHLVAAQILIEQGRFPEAAAEYKKALAGKETKLSARLGLATAYYLDFQLDEAMSQVRRVLAADSRNVEANLLLGKILLRLHRDAEAAPYLEAALKGPPSSLSQIHALLAQSYASQGEAEKAIAEWRLALPADVDGSFHYQLYRLYLKARDQKDAALALRRSQQLWKAQVQPQP